jgi:hypothetical protein
MIQASPISVVVTPANAGVQIVDPIVFMDPCGAHWIPACAGMTDVKSRVGLIHRR